jgi:putative ATP-dependent endonuclease of OLD family
VYLRKLRICNFRKLKSVEIALEPGLNILVGPNNVGKTTVIDALRALLNNQDEPSPRLSEEDIHRPKAGTPAGAIEFHYIFDGLTPDDESDFLPSLVPTRAPGGSEPSDGVGSMKKTHSARR